MIEIFGSTINQSRFLTLIQNNANWFEDYYHCLYYNVHFNHGDEKIRYLPFIAHTCVILDQEFIFELTGNLDADLP
jgi:hypothetical protein